LSGYENAGRDEKVLKIIRYTLVFESPLLISSMLTLPGIYDRITTLDRDTGLPYVPASSIRGRVKDAVRSFLVDNQNDWDQFRLCQGQEIPVGVSGDLAYCREDEPCPLCRSFGAPGGLKRGFEFSGAYYPDDAVELIKAAFGEEDLSAASLARRTRNQRDDKLRRAREDHLFVDGAAEMLTSLEGTVRETPAHLRFDDAIRTFDYRLLLLGLRLTAELGASRSRGYGRCEFCPVDDTNWSEEIEALTVAWKAKRGGGAS
jgi:CRISPR/Cas system CSM-associated protein Csm3 (group 7 of RAMP superfamily)